MARSPGGMKLLAVCGVAALCPFLSGCLLPYAYPHVSPVPAVHLDAEAGEVHAFRVDATVDVADLGRSTDYRLTEVQPAFGHVLPQTGLAFDYGIYVVGIALNYPIHRGHTTLVRLYRPGYGLVEVEAWQLPGKVDWKLAPDLTQQEKAVDALLSAPAIDAPGIEFTYGRVSILAPQGENSDLSGLPPGSASATHRSALLFAASEYQRLAHLAPPDPEGRAVYYRLADKARKVREAADK